MVSNSFHKGTSLKLKIETLAFGGFGISRYNNIVFFVKNGLPGQTVIGKIIKKKKKYFECIIEKIISQSKYAIDPKCLHFNFCGGFSFQNFEYNPKCLHLQVTQVCQIL